MSRSTIFPILAVIVCLASCSRGVQVYAFGKTLELPKDCVLYVRPSVADAHIKYVCNKGGDIIWLFFDEKSKVELNTLLAQDKAALVSDDEGIMHYRATFDRGLSTEFSVEILCNMEVCLSFMGEKMEIFDALFSQISSKNS